MGDWSPFSDPFILKMRPMTVAVDKIRLKNKSTLVVTQSETDNGVTISLRMTGEDTCLFHWGVMEQGKSKWKNAIAPHLRKYMFSKASRGSLIWPILLFVLALAFGILSLAGPVWKRVEVPGMKSTAVFVILMDLSWSMMAEDIAPAINFGSPSPYIDQT